ncbi:MAG: phospholipid carrier-dependent glycosyltransferase [Anaerolineae bacterium]|nr:phospholipid carrier-dependent glycosyltransferase [Anaerolineae bacterium]
MRLKVFSASSYRWLGLVLLMLLAFFLRVWRLDDVPPGWRDDELIDVLVISQKALDGDVQLFYADASGNEGLYHVLNGVMYGLFGATPWGMRGLSAILGLLAIPAVYVVGKQLYDEKVGWLAAASLTISFWSLMYSRFALRQVMTPLLLLLAFICFWRAFSRLTLYGSRSWINDLRLTILDWVGAGVFLGLGFYVYFASRGVPVILLVFCGAMVLVARPRLRQAMPGILTMFAVTILLAIPLFIVLGQQPEAEARVSEVGVPLNRALEGDFSLVLDYTWRTLGMFHATGDDEWLYNIPFRPVFGPVGAIFFWAGVGIALWHSGQLLAGVFRSPRRPPASAQLSSLFLLFWWGAGILPGFLSVPAASLGHTIVAQPAVYILAALPVWGAGQLIARRQGENSQTRKLAKSLPLTFALILCLTMAARDLPDYFLDWPQRGMTRFLYRADIGDVADYLAANPALTDFGISGLLAGPWDRLALEVEYTGEGVVRPRWYHPERAMMTHLGGEPAVNFVGYPLVPMAYRGELSLMGGAAAGGYQLSQAEVEREWQPPACFQNGLCLVWASFGDGVLELGWEVARSLDLPPIPLISNPPPPGVYAGPRLYVFAHLLDEAGRFLTGEDGLWVDPVTLHLGDRWLQQHWLGEREESAAATFGLYDPMTGQRILTDTGQDHLRLDLPES